MMILEGIRVIDWSQWHAAPHAAVMLTDLGAEVIHIEDPIHGDPWRGTKTLLGVPLQLPHGRNLMFEDLNRNKLGIRLNVKNPKGRDIVYELAKKSDVFLTNYRGAEKIGLDYESLRQINPKLIYTLGTGFGMRGPDKDIGSLESTAYARSGAMMAAGEEGTQPVYLQPGMADRITSVYLAYGTLAALLGRQRLGLGQMVTVSQFGAMIVVQGTGVLPTLWMGQDTRKQCRNNQPNPLTNWYMCKDKKRIMLCLFQSDKYWSKLCMALGLPELANDPRFVNAEKRENNCISLISILDDVFALRTYDEWDKALKKIGGFIYSPLNSYSDLASDEQALANQYIVDWDHPDLGQVKYVGHPVEFSHTPQAPLKPAPHFGESTEQVLIDILGLTWEEINLLKDEGII